MAEESGVLRWGVLGTGFIADFFLGGLSATPHARATAVASRRAETADAFADKWGIGRRHSGRKALAEDDEVDIAYIATPHPDHHSSALALLRAGKHVLCEKPLAMNARQAAEMAEAARGSGRFLMEGLWTRFFPVWHEVDRLLADGAIGELRSLHADFGINLAYDPGHRLFAPGLGGGALLDLGIYPVALASRYLGELTVAGAAARMAPNGVVDAHTSAVATGSDGAVATLSCGSQEPLANRAVLTGSTGRIEVERFWCPTEFSLHRDGREPEAVAFPNRANGMEYEIEEVAARINAGEQESPLMPWSESLRIARTLDEIRALTGVVYAEDGAGA